MPSTRYKVQQFDWGFRTYDSQTEEPVEGEIARFDVTIAEAELIENGGVIEIVDNKIVVSEPPEEEE